MTDGDDFSRPREVLRNGGVNRLFETPSRDRGIFHPSGRYDAKTLIRHAMVALEDEMGIQEAQPFNQELRKALVAIRSWEEHHVKGARK